MGKNLALAFVLILSLGAFLFVLQQQGGEGATETDASLTVEAEQEQPRTSESELPSHDAVAEQSRSEDLAVATRDAESSRRDAVGGAVPEDGFTIACVDRHGNPVGDLDAWVLVDSSWKAFEAFVNPRRVDVYLEQHGDPHRVGPEGRLHLPRPDEGKLYVFARGRGFWGSLDVDEVIEPEYKLVMIEDASLRVQVIDADGQPVKKVPVVIERFGTNGSMRPAVEPTGGENGIAVFPHVQTHLAQVEKTTYRVFADIVSLDLVYHELDPDDIPTETIVLQLPPTGRVRARVLGSDWELVTHDASVTLECIPEGEAKVVSHFSPTRRRKVQMDSEAGVALFPHVEIGLELGGEAKRGGSQTGSRAYGPGPLRAGEVVNLDIFMGADHPVVRFRPVRADGKAFGIGTFFCTLQMHTEISRNNSRTYPEIDDQGRVLVDLTNDWQAGKSRYLSVEYRGGFKPFPAGGIDLSRELQNGINDFGDVVLGEPAVFVSGRVESEDGAGIANAKLELNSKGKESAHWGGHWDFRVQTEGDGTFRVTQAIAGDTFRLSAEKAGYACGWTEFKRGDEGVTIVMRSEGQIAGSVLLDDRIPHEMISLRVDHLEEGRENMGGKPSVGLNENGEFLLRGLMPGSRRLVVLAKWQSTELAIFEDVEVVSGEVCRDPRLQQIDLRGLLNVHTIEFLGAEEGQSTGGTLKYGPSGAEELKGYRWFPDGPVQLITPEESLDVFVNVKGYRPVSLEEVRGTVQVQLRTGPRVVLVLTGDGELPEPPHYLKVGLAPNGAENFSVDWSADPFDERREIKVQAPHEGEMQVEWMIERRSPNTSIGMSASLGQKLVVDVLDVEGEQRIEIRMSAAQMKELMDSLP